MSTMTDAERIARGLPPKPWQETFEHSIHGDLTFRAGLPNAMTLAAHSVAIDNLLEDLVGNARASTMILTAAIAGLTAPDPEHPSQGLLVQLPVIDRQEVPDEEKGSVKIVQRYYDAAAEIDIGFLTDVWTSFSLWRMGLLEQRDDVKGSSGETSGSGSSTESAEPSVSPSTTLA